MHSAAVLACLREHSQQSPVGPAAQGAWPSLGTMIHAQGTSWWQQSQDSYLRLWTTTGLLFFGLEYVSLCPVP